MAITKLPHPSTIKNPVLHFAADFEAMTPEAIRAFCTDMVNIQRYGYPALYEHAIKYLGSDSPEAIDASQATVATAN